MSCVYLETFIQHKKLEFWLLFHKQFFSLKQKYHINNERVRGFLDWDSNLILIFPLICCLQIASNLTSLQMAEVGLACYLIMMVSIQWVMLFHKQLMDRLIAPGLIEQISRHDHVWIWDYIKIIIKMTIKYVFNISNRLSSIKQQSPSATFTLMFLFPTISTWHLVWYSNHFALTSVYFLYFLHWYKTAEMITNVWEQCTSCLDNNL